MKVASIASRILTAVLAVAVFVLFFFGIVEVHTASQGAFTLTGIQMVFGTNVSSSTGAAANIEISAWYLFAFIFVVIAAICSCVSFKWKKATIGGIVTGAIAMITLLVFNFNNPASFADVRPISATGIHFTNVIAPVLVWCSVAAFVMSVVTLFVNDYAEVLASNGAKKTLIKRFVAFIREYKSEIKKITWPSFQTVIKNTLIVLIVCAVVGAFIWILDFGLVSLVKLIFK